MRQPTPPEPRPTPSPRWLTLLPVWLAVAALALSLSVQQIDDVDFWWQWKTGEVIARSGIPSTEPFSYARAGTQRIESSWLYCLALHAIATTAGPGALVILKALLIVGAYALVLRARRARWSVSSAVVVGVALVAASGRFVVRPEVVSATFMAAFYFILCRAAEGKTRVLWALPPLTALWTNLHSLYPIGPALVGLWVIAQGGAAFAARATAGRACPEAIRRTTTGMLALGACAAATLVNPYGWRILEVPLRQFAALFDASIVKVAVFSGAVAVGGAGLMWAICRIGPTLLRRSPGFVRSRWVLGTGAGVLLLGPALVSASLAVAGPGPDEAWPEKAFIRELASPLELPSAAPTLVFGSALALLTAVAVVCRPRAVGLFSLLVASATLALAAAAVRNAAFFALAAVPCVVTAAPWRMLPSGGHLMRRLRPLLDGAGTLAAAALAVAGTVAAVSGALNDARGVTRRCGIGVDLAAIPEGAAGFLAAQNITGRLFNTQSLGSYLVWRGAPAFIDSRGVAGIIDEYRAIVDAPTNEPLDHAAARYGFDALAIGTDTPSLIARLRTSTAWRPVFADALTVVYVRAGIADGVRTLDFGSSWSDSARHLATRRVAGLWPVPPSPIPLRRLAGLCLVQGRYEAALRCFEEARRLAPPGFGDEYGMGQAAMGAGAFATAADAFGRALARSPHHAELWVSRATALLNAGKLSEAAGVAARGVEAQPRSAEARYLAGVIAFRQGRHEDAVTMISAAIELDPQQARYFAVRGSSRVQLNRAGAALSDFAEAHRLDPADPSVVANLALLEAERGNTEPARSWARLAWSLKPGDPRMRQIMDAPGAP